MSTSCAGGARLPEIPTVPHRRKVSAIRSRPVMFSPSSVAVYQLSRSSVRLAQAQKGTATTWMSEHGLPTGGLSHSSDQSGLLLHRRALIQARLWLQLLGFLAATISSVKYARLRIRPVHGYIKSHSKASVDPNQPQMVAPSET